MMRSLLFLLSLLDGTVIAKGHRSRQVAPLFSNISSLAVIDARQNPVVVTVTAQPQTPQFVTVTRVDAPAAPAVQQQQQPVIATVTAVQQQPQQPSPQFVTVTLPAADAPAVQQPPQQQQPLTITVTAQPPTVVTVTAGAPPPPPPPQQPATVTVTAEAAATTTSPRTSAMATTGPTEPKHGVNTCHEARRPLEIGWRVVIADADKYNDHRIHCGSGHLANLRGQCGVITDWQCGCTHGGEWPCPDAWMSWKTNIFCDAGKVTRAFFVSTFGNVELQCVEE